MRRPKSVVDVQIRQACQFFGHGLVIFTLFRVKTGVFQNQHLTGLEFCGRFFGDFASAIFRELDRR